MARILTFIAFSLLAVMALTACNQEVVGPETVETADLPGEKRLTPPGLSGPMSFDIFLFMIENNFDMHDWLEVPVDLPVKSGGTISVLPDGYPETHTIQLTIGANNKALVDIEPGTIWVPAPPLSGEYLDIPGDCVIFRTQNIPPSGTGSAKVELPVMPWNRIESFTGQFTTYDLYYNEEGLAEAFHIETVNIEWPLPDPEAVIYVEAFAYPDKDDPSRAIDHVVDPEEPGEDD